jgi:hypothetical protein
MNHRSIKKLNQRFKMQSQPIKVFRSKISSPSMLKNLKNLKNKNLKNLKNLKSLKLNPSRLKQLLSLPLRLLRNQLYNPCLAVRDDGSQRIK